MVYKIRREVKPDNWLWGTPPAYWFGLLCFVFGLLLGLGIALQ